MSIHRSAICALVLFVAMPMVGGGTAEAVTMPDGRIWIGGLKLKSRVAIVDDGTASSVTATIKSDAGDEDVTLVESDAWLHGAASFTALPEIDAALTLTLYDSASASLMSFSGTLGTDGAVTLTADATKDTGGGGTCDASYRTGCTDDTSDTSATTLDIEVLAAEVFAGSSGYELTLDLNGADTYEIAYADLTVTESDEVTTCSKEPRKCTTTGSSTTTTAEVGWDAVGAVWEGGLTLEPEGVIDVKVKSYDASGEEIENTKVALGVPWIDGGEGVNVLALDEDPLTTVGLLGFPANYNRCGWSMHCRGLAVNSSGWTATTVPVAAKVELTDGDTITIPVNSYQRGGGFRPAFFDIFNDVTLNRVTIVSPGTQHVFANRMAWADMSSPTCSNGICFGFITPESREQDIFVHVSVYGSDATTLPDDLELTVTITDEKGNKVSSETETVEFDDDITAVFANEVSFSEDPTGLDLSGKVSLLGTANSKGKQKTLAKGKFYGSFSRDGEGDLTLAGADKNHVEARGDILIGGEPIDFELTTDDNGDGVLNGPPLTVIARPSFSAVPLGTVTFATVGGQTTRLN